MRWDLLDGASGSRGETVERVGDVLRDALQRRAEPGAQTKQLLDLLLELPDLTQAFGTQSGGALLCFADDLLCTARRIAFELVAALANFVQCGRQLGLALAERLDAAVELRDLSLHRICAGACRLELVLQLLMRERRTSDSELDVALPVATQPRAADFRVVCHELRVDR